MNYSHNSPYLLIYSRRKAILSVTFCLILCSVLPGFAQPGWLGQADWAQLTSSGFMVTEKAGPEVTSDPAEAFLNEEWAVSAIYLTNGQRIERFQTRYNLQKQTLILRSPDRKQKAILQGYLADSFLLYPPGGDARRFYQGKLFPVTETPLVGFIEKLVEGQATLFAYPYTELLRANYVPTHDTGSRTDRINKAVSYYATFGSSRMVELPRSKKKFFALFGNQANRVAQVAKQRDWNHHSRDGLIEIFRYYNEGS